MLNEELIKYIKENREKGFSNDVIKKALLEAGWKEEDINNGFLVPPVAGTFVAPKKVKTPLLIIILAWILLIPGLIYLLFAFMALAFNVLNGILGLLFAAGIIATSFGIRKMKKWGLYVFTVAVIVGLVSFFLSEKTYEDILLGFIPIIFLIYLWIISKKFN